MIHTFLSSVERKVFLGRLLLVVVSSEMSVPDSWVGGDQQKLMTTEKCDLALGVMRHHEFLIKKISISELTKIKSTLRVKANGIYSLLSSAGERDILRESDKTILIKRITNEYIESLVRSFGVPSGDSGMISIKIANGCCDRDGCVQYLYMKAVCDILNSS